MEGESSSLPSIQNIINNNLLTKFIVELIQTSLFSQIIGIYTSKHK